MPNKLLAFLKLLSNEDRERFITEYSESIKSILRSLFKSLNFQRRFPKIKEFQEMHYRQYALISKEEIRVSRELIQMLVDSGYTDFSELSIPFHPLGYGLLDGLNLAKTDFSYSHIDTSILRTNFSSAKLDNTHFSGTLFQVDFSNTNLYSTQFRNSKIVPSSTMLNSLEIPGLKSAQFSTRSFSELLTASLGDEISLLDSDLKQVNFYDPIIVAEFTRFTKITFPSYSNLDESAYSLKFSSRQVINFDQADFSSNSLDDQKKLKQLLSLNSADNKFEIKAFHKISNDTEILNKLFVTSCERDKEDTFIENMNIVYELNALKEQNRLTVSEKYSLDSFYKNFEAEKKESLRRKRSKGYEMSRLTDLNEALQETGELSLNFKRVSKLTRAIETLETRAFITISMTEGGNHGPVFSIYKKSTQYSCIFRPSKNDKIHYHIKVDGVTSLKQLLKTHFSHKLVFVYIEKKSISYHSELDYEYLDPLTRNSVFLDALDNKLGPLSFKDKMVWRTDLSTIGLHVKDSNGEWWPVDGNSIKDQFGLDNLRRNQKLQLDSAFFLEAGNRILRRQVQLKNNNILDLVGKEFRIIDGNHVLTQHAIIVRNKLKNFLNLSSGLTPSQHSLEKIHKHKRWLYLLERKINTASKIINTAVFFIDSIKSVLSIFDKDVNNLNLTLESVNFYLSMHQSNIYKNISKRLNFVRSKFLTVSRKKIATSLLGGWAGQVVEPIALAITIRNYQEATGLERDFLEVQVIISGYSLASGSILAGLSGKYPKFITVGSVVNMCVVYLLDSGAKAYFTIKNYEFFNFTLSERAEIVFSSLISTKHPKFLQELIDEREYLLFLSRRDWLRLSLEQNAVMCVSAIGQKKSSRKQRDAVSNRMLEKIPEGSKRLIPKVRPKNKDKTKTNYQDRKPIDAEIDLREGQNKQEIFLVRFALDSAALPDNATLSCSPGLNSTTGVGMAARTEVFNSNGVQCIADSEKLKNISVDKGKIKINTELFQSGKITGSDKWNNEFYLAANSRVAVYGGGNSVKKSQINHFYYMDKNFSGSLYGGVSSDVDRKVVNILDLRLLEGIKHVLYSNNTLKLDEKLIPAQAMNYYFGPEGAIEQIDCNHMPLDFVSTGKGASNATHQLQNCKIAELYPNTQVNSDLSGMHVYSIQFGHGDISINARQAENITLIFTPDCDLLSANSATNFYYHPNENIFEVEFIKKFKTLRVKSTFLNKMGNPSLHILLGKAELIVNFGDLLEIKKKGQSVTDLSIQQFKIGSASLIEAKALESFYLGLTNKHRVVTKILEETSNSTAIVGSAFSDYFLIDNQEEKTIVYGGDGADFYSVDPNSEELIVNNFANDGIIDEAIFSDEDLTSFYFQKKDYNLTVQSQSKNLLNVYNYFKKREYRHLVFKNKLQSFVLLQEEKTLRLVPYFLFKENGAAINIDKDLVRAFKDVAIDLNLNNLFAYRKNDDLLFTANLSYRNLLKNHFISLTYVNYYRNPEVFDTFTLWGAAGGELITDNGDNKFDKATLANFATLAIDLQMLNTQIISNYQLSERPVIENIYHNQVRSGDNYYTVPDSEKKVGTVEFSNLASNATQNLTLNSEESNLIADFRDVGLTKRLVLGKWDNPLHRTDSFQFNDGFVVTGLSLYGLDNLSEMQIHINKAYFNHLLQADFEKNITPEAFEDLKVVLYFRALEKNIPSYNYLGFYSSSEEEKWLLYYFAKYSKTKSFKRLETLLTGESGKNQIKALLEYAIKVHLNLEVNFPDIKIFFDLIPADVFDALLPDFTFSNKTVDESFNFMKENLDLFANYIQDIHQQDLPQWMANLKQAFNDETIDEKGDQAEIKPRVGAQVHSAYQEERMLGDQPVNGFIHEESHATYSTEPPRIGVDSSSSSSSSGITNILGKVDVNGILLATRYIIGNTDLPPTQNISPESKKEAYMEELMLTVEAAFKKEWEESESETSGGFWNWLIGGLGAGVGLIAGLVWRVKKGRSKNLSSNEDLENGISKSLNTRDENNLENTDSLNLIPVNERTALFGGDGKEGGTGGGSSSFPTPMNDLFAHDSDSYVETKPQKKTVKHAQERLA